MLLLHHLLVLLDLIQLPNVPSQLLRHVANVLLPDAGTVFNDAGNE